MPDLGFKIEGAEVVKFSATPLIAFKLRVSNADPAETIHSVALRSQIQIEVTRRRYTAEDQEKLRDLFGDPDRWSQTLRNLLWTHVNVNVPPFQGSTLVDLPVPCTFDFNVGATKYFHGLETDRFAEIIYECSRVSASGSGDRYWVALNGELTLHGVTQAVPVSARVVINGDSVRATGDFSVKQSDFEIPPVTAAAGTIRIKDEVKCTFDIVARKQE